MAKQSTSVGRLVLVATMSLLLSACGGGGGASTPPPPSVTGVSGSVTNTRGGPAVQGATITASGAMVSATTNSQGAYTLSLSPGTYDILAAAPASGMAASKLQSVSVTMNQTTTANLIMFPVFNSTKPVAAPTISVTGLTQGQTVSGTVPFTVTVTASNPVRRIGLRTSTMSALPQTELVDTATANLTLISTALTNGPGFVDIITYDLNQNAAELIVNFTVMNTLSGTPPAPPAGISMFAVTTGQSLGLFSTRRAQLFTQLGVNQNPSILRVGGSSINIQTAPSNATLFVEARWSPVTGATGYKVFRSPNATGPFIPVAQVTYACNAPPPASCFYDDPDPSLTPGVPVYYQVSAFNAGGESAATTPVGVTPLPAFNLTLTSPASNATGISTTPLFTWTLTPPVGTDQFYDIFVTGLNDPSPAWKTSNFSIVDVTSVNFGGPVPLQSGKVYQWDIYEAQAQTVYAPNSAAIAVANGSGQVATGSLNGPFTFTTAL